MDIKLRIEQSSDYHETENITREAFWNHYSPGCDEHYLLHIMRTHPTFVPVQGAFNGLRGYKIRIKL